MKRSLLILLTVMLAATWASAQRGGGGKSSRGRPGLSDNFRGDSNRDRSDYDKKDKDRFFPSKDKKQVYMQERATEQQRAVTAAPVAVQAGESAAPVASATAPPAPARSEPVREVDSRWSYGDFRLLTQRNIFDKDRRAPEPPREFRPPPPAAPRIETLDIIGALITESGAVAFVEGGDGDRQVKPGDTYGGFRIMRIDTDVVTVASGGVKQDIPVGARLQRPAGGEWKLVEAPAASDRPSLSSSSSGSSDSGDSASSSPAPNASIAEMLKRLREKRAQE